MTLDLTDDEARALAQYLRRALDEDPFPFAPWLDPLKAILAKLEPPAPRPESLPPLKPGLGRASDKGADGEASGDRSLVDGAASKAAPSAGQGLRWDLSPARP